ncbi:AI-2E family transporter [Nocardioides sp. STR2]|uniref:AI-2E family transporter n=1 Tax=Nocardioides pini TaxID=2975053 RepID=A0ABT4CCT5_9ACTN|nr:AI-2E family transporter [Nocardioides pini]MCY4726754.1 AI-2E family transporter [Nocardioides pini]
MTDDGARSPTLPRSVVVLLGVVGVVALGIGIKAAAGIIAPAVLALVLTIAVLPIHRWTKKHGWPGWCATLAALAGAYLILLVMVVGTAVCLIKFADLLPSYAKQAKDLTTNVEDGLANLGLDTSSTSAALSKLDPTKLAGYVAGLVEATFGFLGFLFFLVTLMFFFVVAIAGFGPRVTALRRSKPGLAAALGTFVSGSQTYLLMSALFGAIVGVLDAGALWLLGVPLPLVWGFFSFLTNFIPNIGFVIGVIPPAFLALLDDGWEGLLWVVLVYSVLNVTIQTFIQPRVVGNSVGLSAEITFLSLVVWTFLLGALGALLAVPMTLLMRAIFLDSDPRAAWVAPLIDATVEDEPEPS